MWLRLRLWIGRILNLGGFPGFIRDGSYSAKGCKAEISVTVTPLFTIIRVNSLDVYFHRITGKVDGIGFNQTSDCRGSRPQLERSA